MPHRMGQWMAAVALLIAADAAAQPTGNVETNRRVDLSSVPPGGSPPLPAAGKAETRPTSRQAASEAAENRPVLRRDPREEEKVGSNTTSTIDYGDWWRVLVALAVVLVLILAAKNLIRRYVAGRKPGGQEGIIEVLTRTPVSPKHQVMLIRVAQRVLVVAAGADGMNTLTEITDPEQVSSLLGAVERGRAGSLTNAFAKALQGRQSEFAQDSERLDAENPGDPPTPAGSAAERLKGVVEKVRQLGSPFRRRG